MFAAAMSSSGAEQRDRTLSLGEHGWRGWGSVANSPVCAVRKRHTPRKAPCACARRTGSHVRECRRRETRQTGRVGDERAKTATRKGLCTACQTGHQQRHKHYSALLYLPGFHQLYPDCTSRKEAKVTAIFFFLNSFLIKFFFSSSTKSHHDKRGWRTGFD